MGAAVSELGVVLAVVQVDWLLAHVVEVLLLQFFQNGHSLHSVGVLRH